MFLHDLCTICTLAGAGMTTTILASCSTFPVYRAAVIDKRISIPLSIFLKSPLQILRAAEIEYDIAVRKFANDRFRALLLRCTHADNEVSPSGDGFYCSAHGSRYDEQGHVTRGPAQSPLEELDTVVETDVLIIHIPERNLL
jgi:nitrite reductase/ring-hydroxylating ferredoxin subunit